MSLSQVDRLTLLWEVSHIFNTTLNLEEVLNLVVDQVVAALRAERGIVLLYDVNHRLQVCVARGVDQQALESPEFEFSRSIVEDVAKEGEPRLTSDAQDDLWLSQRQSVQILGLRSVLCVPLQTRGSLIGVIYVDNRLQVGVFMPEDLELLTTIASSAAVAIENARLYEIAVEKGRLEQELKLARSLQASFIPQSLPKLPGWELAAGWHPAHEVSGDFYDFLTLDSRELGLVIADVSDKGMAAALFMTLTRTIVRASVTGASPPATAIGRVNRLLCADATDGMFVTLFYLALDPASGTCTYVNAGHNPPLLVRAQDPVTRALTRTGMLLGIDETTTYAQETLHLATGDLIFFYTDGIPDAMSPTGDFFGAERLRQIIASHQHLPADAILAKVMEKVQTFTSGATSFDDITLLVLKRL